jgi:hypothetical protein
MSAVQKEAHYYIERISGEKLGNAVSYLRYLYEQDCPLDDFDYELAKLADLDSDLETVTFDNLMNDVGLTHDNLSN